MYKLLTATLLLTFGIANGQSSKTVLFLDNQSNEPITEVFIYDKGMTKTSLSNDAGKSDLSMFTAGDTLFCTHRSYVSKRLIFATLDSVSTIRMERKTVFLNEFTIAANKRPLRKSDVPNRIEIISSDEITFNNPQTSADLLDMSGQVYVQKSQLGGGSPMIRGFSANRILLVVDGVRMNNAIFRSGNLQNSISIDPHVVDRTEVVYGPGSVIYGSDALGGVVEYLTKSPTYAKGDSLNTSGSFLSRYSTANREKTQHFDLSVASKRVGILTSFTYSSFSDLRAGTRGGDENYLRPWYQEREGGEDVQLVNPDPNLQLGSAYNQVSFSQKIMVKVGAFDLDYALHFSNTSDIPRYDRLVQPSGDGTPRNAEWYYGPQKWLMNKLTAETKKPGVLFGAVIYDRMNLTLANQGFEESRNDRRFQSTALRSRTENVSAWSANLDLDKRLNASQNLYYGFEWVDNTVRSTGIRRDISTGEQSETSTRYPDGSEYNTLSAYVNYANKLNKNLNLTGGLRYANVHTRAEFDTANYDFPYDNIDDRIGAFSGSIGLAWKVSEVLQVNGNLASGFRAPNIDDLAKVFDSEPGNVIVPNPDLLPEYTYNADLGVYANPWEHFGVEASAFATYLDNALIRSDFKLNGQDSILYDGEMSKVQALTNADHAMVMGYFIRLRLDVTRSLSVETMYTYNVGVDSEGNPLRHASPSFGSSHLIYTNKRLKVNVYARYNGELSNDELAPSEQSKAYLYASDANGNPYSPSWATLNAKASWTLAEHIRFDVGIENITDELYRTYSSGISAPGRNVIVGLRAWL